jgi:hypothetical protein
VLASQSSHAMRALLRATKSRRLATEAAGTSSRED